MNMARPEIFYLFALLYLLLGVFAIHDPAMLAVNPTLAISHLTIIVWLFGFLCLFLGIRLSGRGFQSGPAPLVIIFPLGCIILNYMLGIGWIISIALNAIALLGCWIILNLDRLIKGPFKPILMRLWPGLARKVYWEYMFLFGLAVSVLNFMLSGVPLLNPGLHYDLIGAMTFPFIFSFYLMLYSCVRFYAETQGKGNPLSRGFLLILLIVSIFSSFRSYIAIVLFTWLFLELSGRRINARKIFPAVLAGVLAVLLFAFLGWSSASSGDGWNPGGLGPLSTLEYRTGFTNHVFDDVVKKAFPWGYSFGSSLERPFGVHTCYALYGCENRLTSGLLGEIMLDFGLPGIFLLMLFAGVVLQRLYKRDYPLYAFMIAHLIVSLEIGAGYLFILMFAYLGYLGALKKHS